MPQFAIFAGPAIAGWILVNWGIAIAFTVNVAGYAIYFATIAFLKTPADFKQAKSQSRSMRQDIVEGARYILAHKGLSSLLLLVLAGDAVTGAVYQMLPAYSGTVLHTGVGNVSLLFGAAGLGATIAALWLAQGGAARATPLRVIVAVFGVAVSVYFLALSNTIAISVAAMLLFGFAGETRRTGTVSIMQLAVDDAQRARVMSALFLLTRLAGGIGTVTVGAVAEHTGLRLPLVIAATIALIAWLVIFRKRREISAAFTETPPPR